MARASNQRDSAHARIYAYWIDLKAWKNMSPRAKALLVEIMMRYRPGENGKLAYSAKHAAEILKASKSTAARTLRELDDLGWLRPAKLTSFAGHNGKSSLYRLTMFDDDTTGEPPTRDFLYM